MRKPTRESEHVTQVERRFHQRYRRAVPFELERDGRRTRVVSVNTSAGGAFVRAPAALPLGEYWCWLVDRDGGRRDLGLAFEAVHSTLPDEPGAESSDHAKRHGLGGRWVTAISRDSPEAIEGFLANALGIVGPRIRKSSDGQGPLFRFDFPKVNRGSGLDAASGLADLLEPPRPGEPSNPIPAARPRRQPNLLRRILNFFWRARTADSAPSRATAVPPSGGAKPRDSAAHFHDAAPTSRAEVPRTSAPSAPSGPTYAPAFIPPASAAAAPAAGSRVPPSLKASAPTSPTRVAGEGPEGGAGPRGSAPVVLAPVLTKESSVQAAPPEAAPIALPVSGEAVKRRRAMRDVPTIQADVRAPDGRFSALLFRLSTMSMDLSCSGSLPSLYQRVVVTMSIPVDGKEVEVRITGTVTRQKQDRRFTVRYVKVEEGGHRGAFERFVHEVTAPE